MTKRTQERMNREMLVGAARSHERAIVTHEEWVAEVERLSAAIDATGGTAYEHAELRDARDRAQRSADKARIAEDWMMRCQGLVDEALELAVR